MRSAGVLELGVRSTVRAVELGRSCSMGAEGMSSRVSRV